MSATQMSDRQLFALTHPVNDPDDLTQIPPHRSIRQRGDNTLLVVVLAVDR